MMGHSLGGDDGCSKLQPTISQHVQSLANVNMHPDHEMGTSAHCHGVFRDSDVP